MRDDESMRGNVDSEWKEIGLRRFLIPTKWTEIAVVSDHDEPTEKRKRNGS